MKTNFILVLFSLFSLNAFSASKADIPKSVIDLDVMEVGYSFVEGNDENGSNKFYPEHVEEELLNFSEQLYMGGIAKLEHLKDFECRVKELKKIEEIRAAIGDYRKRKCYKNFLNRFNDSCKSNPTFSTYFSVKDSDKDKFHKKYNCDGKVSTNKYNVHFGGDSKKHVKALYHALYASLFAKFRAQVISDPARKVGEWEMSTVKQCEAPFQKLPWVLFQGPTNCKPSNGEDSKCTKHEDCCSMFCSKDPGKTEGKCAMETSCYRLLQPLEECGVMSNGRVNPYCDNAQMRYLLDPRPEKDKESIKPAPGTPMVKCIETNWNTSEIQECTLNGQTPTASKPCCSDKVGAGGKCIIKMTCDHCLQGGSKPTGDQKCCPGFYKSLSGICIQDFPPLSLPLDASIDNKKIKKSYENSKNIFEKVLDFIFPSAYANPPGVFEDTSNHNNCVAGVSCSNNLSAEQEDAIETLRSNCIAKDPNSGAEPTQAEIDACLLEASKLENQFMNENIKSGSGGEGGQWTRESYMEKFNMTAITAKTASDFKKCEFNSFNDSWRSASNMERNAEIVIRGFEYTFSGMGTNDYWIDKNGLSIYERAKNIATKVRRFRTDMIHAFHEIDRSMACKCIAIMGPAKYPDKADFFNSKCEKEKAMLAESIGGADGTSSNENLSKVQLDQAQTGETDLGASGISHEKLLMEYLDRRITAQFDRFKYNAELEADLTELSQFIIDTDWELSWEEGKELYKFNIKRMAKWLKIAIIVVAIAVAVAAIIVTMGGAAAMLGVLGGTGGALFGAAAGIMTTIGLGSTAILAGTIGAGLVAAAAITGTVMTNKAWNANNAKVEEFVANAASRSIFSSEIERRIYDRTDGEWYTHWFKQFRRFTRFYMYPYFKSGHAKDDRHNTHGLPSSIPADKVCEVYGSSRVCFKNAHATMYEGEPRFLLDVKFPEFVPEDAFVTDSKFLEKLKASFSLGITVLKLECPGCNHDRNTAKKTDFLDKDTLTDHEKAFLPDGGKWKPEPFNLERYFKFHAGVQKYAECIELEKCGAKYLDESDKDVFGFGFLFENRKDVDNFASYVYQHHFHWPSLSTSGMVAYPTMAMASYFEAMVYNLKLVGSLASNRALKMGDLYDKYKSDWDKRKEDYALGSSAQMGGDSKNAAYSKKFRMMFKKLNFKTGVGVADFQGQNGEINLDGSGLSANELDAMKKGVNKALRAAEHAKKAAHYAATVGNTPRGKIKQNAQKKFMAKFSEPLRTMPLTVGGKQFGMYHKSTNNVTNNYSEPDAPKGALSSYKAPKFDFSSMNNSYGGGSSFKNKSSDLGMPKHGVVKTKDFSHLLDSAAKNQASFERDESDSLFKIVSKAYFRNLSKVLTRHGEKKEIDEDIDLQNKLDTGAKNKLKSLLNE